MRTRLKRWLREARMRLGTRHVSGPARTAVAPGQLVVVGVVRNGEEYVSEYLHHYRQLGASHIVLLDNGSTDATVALASHQPDVTVLHSRLPFPLYQGRFRQMLARRFAWGRWCLCADIDELFDYPASDRLRLPEFLAYLSGGGYTSVVSQMLDLFPKENLLQPLPGRCWREASCYFDLSAVEKKPHPTFAATDAAESPMSLHLGGIRQTGFGVQPLLTKHPLVFVDRRMRWTPGCHFAPGSKVADVSTVLLHYKFTERFAERVRDGVERACYYQSSAEYRGYLKAIEHAGGTLSLHSRSARRYQGTQQLIEAGFLRVSRRYEEWTRKAGVSSGTNKERMGNGWGG